MDICEQLNNGKEHVALRITSSGGANYSYGEINIDILYVKPNKAADCDSMGFYANHLEDKNHFKKITLHAYMSKGSTILTMASIDIKLSSPTDLTLQDLDVYNKALRSIDRKMNNISKKEGYTDNFIELSIRLARIIGAKSFFREFNGKQQRHDNISLLRHHVESEITKLSNQLNSEQAA
jgi:hypothetical protein